MFNPELSIRELTRINDIQVFDLCFILELLNKKYGLNYSHTDFNVLQKVEHRKPTPPSDTKPNDHTKLWSPAKSSCNLIAKANDQQN